MWRGVIDQHDDAAVMRYIAPDYIQHNTKLATGREALREAVRQLALPGALPHPAKAVSYTHLDVYKRQGPIRAPRCDGYVEAVPQLDDQERATGGDPVR